MGKIFIGFDSIKPQSNVKENKRQEMNDFTKKLVEAGFPQENITSVRSNTGVWIKVDGTILTITEKRDPLTSICTKSLFYNDITLATSVKRATLFGEGYFIYNVFPEALQYLPQNQIEVEKKQVFNI